MSLPKIYLWICILHYHFVKVFADVGWQGRIEVFCMLECCVGFKGFGIHVEYLLINRMLFHCHCSFSIAADRLLLGIYISEEFRAGQWRILHSIWTFRTRFLQLLIIWTWFGYGFVQISVCSNNFNFCISSIPLWYS